MSRILARTLSLAWLILATGAHAQVAPPTKPAPTRGQIARGAVVKIEQQEVYVSLGQRQGVTDGARLRLKRPVRLRHPITRAMVSDWVPLGAATVTQAGSELSRAVLGELAGAVKVGDLAEVLVEPTDLPTAPEPPATAPPIAIPTAPAVPADPATLEVLQVFAAQSGQPLEARIASWERFLSTHAGSPYAARLREEVEALRRLRDELSSGLDERAEQLVTTVRHQARDAAPAGVALPLVFVLERPEQVASAFLHYRARGARTFHSLLLTREHDRYLRGQIPAELLRPPGLDYFVEVSAPSGRSGLALGSPDEPIQVAVESPPLIDRFGAVPGRSRVRLAAEYLDFASLDQRPGDRTDRLFSASIDFTYRLAGAIEALGVGYGVLSGRGGFADATWDAEAPAPRSGFRYGYADLELSLGAAVPLTAAMRLIAGVGREGFGLGAEARLRLGALDAANLELVARTIEELGFLSEVRFGAPLGARLGLGLSVAATDLPLQENTGVKLGTELQWQGPRNLSLLLRASWQGRNTHHGGLGGGAGLGVSW